MKLQRKHLICAGIGARAGIDYFIASRVRRDKQSEAYQHYIKQCPHDAPSHKKRSPTLSVCRSCVYPSIWMANFERFDALRHLPAATLLSHALIDVFLWRALDLDHLQIYVIVRALLFGIE